MATVAASLMADNQPYNPTGVPNMNPNARKRLASLPKHEQCPDTRKPGEGNRTNADRKADKNRLFTPKNKDIDMTMRRIDHHDFRTYASPRGRVRIPRSRMMPPRQCMADGFTIAITRQRAASLLNEMRHFARGRPIITAGDMPKQQSKLTRKLTPCPQPPHDPDPQGPRREACTRLWMSWMHTSQKLSFEQFKARWVAMNSA